MERRKRIHGIEWYNFHTVPAMQGDAFRALQCHVGGQFLKIGYGWIGQQPVLIAIIQYKDQRVVAVYEDCGTSLIPIYHKPF